MQNDKKESNAAPAKAPVVLTKYGRPAKKRGRKRLRCDSDREIAKTLGAAIKTLRCKRRILQTELASTLNMLPAQLCNIERGNTTPSIPTLQRIATALDVTVDEIMNPRAYSDALVAVKRGAAKEGSKDEQFPYSKGALPYLRDSAFSATVKMQTAGIARISPMPPTANPLTADDMDRISRKINEYLRLENECSIARFATIPLHLPFMITPEGAEHLANLVRMHFGIGSAIVYDYVELFETRGLRVLFEQLPDTVEGVSFYDAINRNVFIVIREGMTPEKQLFRLVAELGNVYLYTALNNKAFNGQFGDADDMLAALQPVPNKDEYRHFAKHFAATFLMPAEAVCDTVSQLHIQPIEWSFEMVLRLKLRFGISAEAFAHRLEELNLMHPSVRSRIKKMITHYYFSHDYAEPSPSDRKLSRNGRYKDLKLMVKIRNNGPIGIDDIVDELPNEKIDREIDAAESADPE